MCHPTENVLYPKHSCTPLLCSATPRWGSCCSRHTVCCLQAGDDSQGRHSSGVLAVAQRAMRVCGLWTAIGSTFDLTRGVPSSVLLATEHTHGLHLEVLHSSTHRFMQCVVCCVAVPCRHQGCRGCAAADVPAGINSRGAAQAPVSAGPGAGVAGAAAGVRVVDLWPPVAGDKRAVWVSSAIDASKLSLNLSWSLVNSKFTNFPNSPLPYQVRNGDSENGSCSWIEVAVTRPQPCKAYRRQANPSSPISRASHAAHESTTSCMLTVLPPFCRRASVTTACAAAGAAVAAASVQRRPSPQPLAYTPNSGTVCVLGRCQQQRGRTNAGHLRLATHRQQQLLGPCSLIPRWAHRLSHMGS